ncbi:MAG: tRNA uridine-5-carboxymethylaminomethyl(34) synthesis GTPase MnmE, partial [Pseudomonadota bacterium]
PRMMVLAKLRRPSAEGDGSIARSGEIIDEALVVYFTPGASFTGEAVVELHLHGGKAVVATALRTLGDMEGVRPAPAGGFTRRALDAGRLDLTQVEALADLIDAETEAQHTQAVANLDQRLTGHAQRWREELLTLRADLEARLDFADEGDIVDPMPPALGARLTALEHDVGAALATAHRGEIVRDGFRVVIAGPPNAGKSSLLNALAGRDAAIVADQPGTTRDTVSVALDLGGQKVLVTDTAGLRATDDTVEAAGIDRAHAALSAAHAVLWLTPAGGTDEPSKDRRVGAPVSPAPDLMGDRLAAAVQTSRMEVLSRADEAPGAAPTGLVRLSVHTGEGMDTIIAWLTAQAKHGHEASEPALIANARQRTEVAACAAAITDAALLTSAEHAQPELIAEHLRIASDALGRLVGTIGTEELLGKIFASFCIGK